MSRIEKHTLRRSRRIQQKKHSEAKQKNNKKPKLQEQTQYFRRTSLLNDGTLHVAHIRTVNVTRVQEEETSTATSTGPEKNCSIVPNISSQKETHSSGVSQIKKQEKLSRKPRRKSNKKDTPAALSSTTKNPVVQPLDNIIEVPYEGSSSDAQPCSFLQFPGELPPPNNIRLNESNSNDQFSHIHHVSMPSSVTILNQLSDRNNVADVTEGHASAHRHRCGGAVGRPHHQEYADQFCELGAQTIPTWQSVNTMQTQNMPQVSHIDRNRTPGHMPCNTTQEAPTLLQRNQMQDTFSRQLFPPRPTASGPQSSCSIPNPLIHPRGNINFGYCNHPRGPICSNYHNIYHHMPVGLPNLPLTDHFQQANTVQHFVHYVNPPISNSLAAPVHHHYLPNQQSHHNNTLPSGQRQGVSAQGTTGPEVFNYNKHASRSTQQHSNSRVQTKHTVFLPFCGNTPVEVEIK